MKKYPTAQPGVMRKPSAPRALTLLLARTIQRPKMTTVTTKSTNWNRPIICSLESFACPSASETPLRFSNSTCMKEDSMETKAIAAPKPRTILRVFVTPMISRYV